MKSKTSHILAFGIIAASSAFVQPAMAGPGQIFRSMWNAVKGTEVSKSPVAEIDKSIEEFAKTKKLVSSQTTLKSEKRTLEDGSLLLMEKDGHISVIRPPGVDKPKITLQMPENSEALNKSIAGYPTSKNSGGGSTEEMSKALNSVPVITAKGSGPDETIEILSGNFKACNLTIWSTSGELKTAITSTPNLKIHINRSPKEISIVYQETHRSNALVPSQSKDTSYETVTVVDIPATTKLETYALSETGQLSLRLKAPDGTLTVKTIDLRTAEVAKSEATKAEWVSQHLQSAASID